MSDKKKSTKKPTKSLKTQGRPQSKNIEDRRDEPKHPIVRATLNAHDKAAAALAGKGTIRRRGLNVHIGLDGNIDTTSPMWTGVRKGRHSPDKSSLSEAMNADNYSKKKAPTTKRGGGVNKPRGNK